MPAHPSCRCRSRSARPWLLRSLPGRGPSPRSQLRNEKASAMPRSSPLNFNDLDDLGRAREVFTCASLTSAWARCCRDARAVAARDPRELAHQHARPPEDVLFAHVGAHVRHAVAALSRRHLDRPVDRKSTRLNSSHGYISYAVFCLKKKKKHY